MSYATERHLLAFTSEDRKHVVNGAEVDGGPIAGDAEVRLVFGLGGAVSAPSALKRRKVRLAQVNLFRASGASVTTYTIQVADAAGAATTDYAVKYLGAATAPGTRTDTEDIDRFLYTDTEGNLYFQPNGDAADTFRYALWFEVLR